jgi:hypothetical protein
MEKRNYRNVFKIVPLALIFLFSCSHNRSENTTAVEILNEGLVNSCAKIDSESNSLYRLIEAKLLDPKFSPQANLWQPVASKIQLFSDHIYIYIDSLKNDLNHKPDLFKSNEKGNELFNRLINYKQNLLELNPEINSVFRNRVLLISKPFDFQISNQKDFNQFFLNNPSTETKLALLIRFQNNIRIIENDLASFCYSKIDTTISDYNNFSLFISQSGYDVSPGQNIQLLVGVGIFSKASQPKIIIDGNRKSIGENGAVDYTFQASNQIGIHAIPIKVYYTNLKGITESKSDTVKYNVGKRE